MKCPTCGKENDTRALFCDNCGTALAAKTAAKDKAPEQWVESPEPRQGTSAWAIVAAVGGGCVLVGLVLIAILAAILFPVFRQAREKARAAACMSNLKQMSLGVLMYAQDHSGKVKEGDQVIEGAMYPLADMWTTGIDPYIKNTWVFRCPSVAPQQMTPPGGFSVLPPATDYGFNAALSGIPDSKVTSPAQTVLFFESNGVSAGGAQNLAQPGRHNDGNNFAFADGHVKWFRDGTLSPAGVIWSPIDPAPRIRGFFPSPESPTAPSPR